MKILTTNSVIKKIILILLVVIMLNNFIVPNYVRADDSFATKLAKGFFGLLARLGDWVLQLMQYVMVGQSSLKNLGEYEIMYSPGIIFSNEVPALQIDFIGQNTPSKEYKYNATNIKSEEQLKKLLERCKEENKQIGESIKFKRKQLHTCIMALFPFEDKNKSYVYTFIQVWNYRFDILTEYSELKDGSITGGDHAERLAYLGSGFFEFRTLYK